MDGKTIDDTTAHLLLLRERTRVTDALAQYERAVLAVAEALHTKAPEQSDAYPISKSLRQQEPSLLVSITEASRLLGISRSALYQLMSRGEIEPIRIGCRRLIPRKSLEALAQISD